MNTSKMIIVIVTCLSMATAIKASAGVENTVQPVNCTSPSQENMTNAATKTVNNCQTGLDGVGGLGALVAALVKTALGLVFSLLKQLIIALKGIIAAVVKILNIILVTLTKIISLIIALLNNIISSLVFQKKCDEVKQNTNYEMKQATNNSGLNTSILGLIAKLLAAIFGLTGKVSS